MNTYRIQLKNTSFEKYQMAVRVLETIGVEIEEEKTPISDELATELRRRFTKLMEDPTKTILLEDVKQKILEKRNGF